VVQLLLQVLPAMMSYVSLELVGTYQVMVWQVMHGL